MSIGVLALVGVSPERLAALSAAGYTVHEGKKHAQRVDALRAAGAGVKAVLTNGRGGISGDEMGLLPNLEIVCTVGAGYEAVDLDAARRRGIVPSYAIIIREHFPASEAGTRVGLVIMCTLFGMALGGWMSGKVFDVTGSYHAAFLNGIGWNAVNLTIAFFLLYRVRGLTRMHRMASRG